MSGTVTPATAPGPRARGRLTRRTTVGLGLLLTFVGLFLLAGTLPAAPGALERAAALAGAGIAAVWIGGVLLGSGGRR